MYTIQSKASSQSGNNTHTHTHKIWRASTQIILTLIPSHCESWWALLLRSELPAFVTNKAGVWKLPWRSVRRRKASRAEGKSFFPRTITPSMSKRNPKRPFGNNWNTFSFKIYNIIINNIRHVTPNNLCNITFEEEQMLWATCKLHSKKVKKKSLAPILYILLLMWDNAPI